MKKCTLKIEYVSANNLLQNPKNPRKHSPKQVKQIAASISQFGFVNPILIDSSGQIIAGHGRLLAAKDAGYREVPVVKLDHISSAQAKALMIADNKLTENAEWDEALLSEVFVELSELELDFDLEITGFETGEIDFYIEGAQPANENDLIDELPEEVPVNPVSKPGDIWILGKNRILCGNSLEPDSYKLLMDDKKADLIFIDPPYNVPVDGHICGNGKIKHREFSMAAGEMSEPEFIKFLKDNFSLLKENSVDGSIHFVCMDWRHSFELLSASREVYDDFKNICVWNKTNAGMGTFYRSKHEFVFVFKSGKGKHRNNFELGQYGRHRSNVWDYAGVNSFSRGEELAMHPTVKPVEMVADAIMDCSKRGDVVLDTFLGSGSTLIAAEKTGRICYGIEIDPAYIDVIITRWQKFTGLEAVHASTGQTFNSLRG